MSGVRLGFNIGQYSDIKTSCDATGPASKTNVGACETAVQNSAVWTTGDSVYAKCKSGKPTSLTCSKLYIREPKTHVIQTMQATSNSDPNYLKCWIPGGGQTKDNCALAFGLKKWFSDLGLNPAATVVTIPNTPTHGVEWAWGLYKLVNNWSWNGATKLKIDEHAVAVSDCGPIDPSSQIQLDSIVNTWIHS